MKDQLIKYVDLLFAGAPDASDIKQEILQNTLDKYEDLIAQGKSPQAAYSLAISGIGDIHEILGSTTVSEHASQSPTFDPAKRMKPEYRNAPLWKKILRAAAIFLYIISIIPLIILSELGMEIIGLCGTVGIVAIATAMIIIASGSNKASPEQQEKELPGPQNEVHKAVTQAISTAGLVLYLVVSFSTGAWYITWLIFPIMGAAQGLVKACMDLKEAKTNEN